MNFFVSRAELTSKSEGVPHEDLFHSCLALWLTSFVVVAARAPTVFVTVPVVFETLAVELQTP